MPSLYSWGILRKNGIIERALVFSKGRRLGTNTPWVCESLMGALSVLLNTDGDVNGAFPCYSPHLGPCQNTGGRVRTESERDRGSKEESE